MTINIVIFFEYGQKDIIVHFAVFIPVAVAALFYNRIGGRYVVF